MHNTFIAKCRVPFNFLIISFGLFSALSAQTIDLSNASVLASPSLQSPMKETYVGMLIDEVTRRTGIKLQAIDHWSTGKKAIIALALSGDEKLAGVVVPNREEVKNPENKNEGFHLFSAKEKGQNVVWVIGHDARGVLFGIGQLLRTVDMHKGNIFLPQGIDVATSPAYPIRGHQLGYRNTANSWDAWSVDQYEQYIRELALFGANAIENIPFQDDALKAIL